MQIMESLECVEKFYQTYKTDPEGVSFCPYRVCPIGAHSDQNKGKITGLAIDKGIHIAYKAKQNGVVEMRSLQFDKRAQWHISSVSKEKANDWADYLRGATLILSQMYPLTVGLSGVIEGSLPIGGLSSSAAVTISFVIALARVNRISLTDTELIQIALKAETDYVGVSVGTLDPSCEVLCKKDQLLYLDTLDESYELIPTSKDMKHYEIIVFFSGLQRSLSGSKYNMRVDESWASAYALKAFSGMEYGKFNESFLRDIPREIFESHKYLLPDNWRKRAEHWYGEFSRVEQGAEAWRRGDLETYGKLSFESGYSSIYNWETGSPQLIKLYELIKSTDGVYGGRFSGAGFKGCCIALIDPSFEQSVVERISGGYLKEFPELEGKYSVHICHSADGALL